MKKSNGKTGADRRTPAGKLPKAQRSRSIRAPLPAGSIGHEGNVHPAGEREDFRDIAETFSLVIFECDTEGRITFANSPAFDRYGYTREDLERGIRIFDTIASPDRSRAIKTLQDIAAGGRSPGNEYRALRKDGSTFPVIIYTSPIVRDERVVGTRGIVIDISIRKRFEEALRESEERFRNIVEKGATLFYVHSCDHVFTYMSPQVERILGYKPEEALVRWTDLASDHPVNKRAIEFTRKAVETGERQPPYEVEFVARDGRRVWFEIDEAPVVHEGKTVSIVGAAQDITERRSAQEELRKLGAVVHSTSDLVNLTTLDGKMIFLNEAGGKMLGISPGDAQDFRIDAVISPAYKDLMKSTIIPTLLKGGRWEGDMQYRNILTGRFIDAHMLAFSIRDRVSGAQLYFANVSRDITERKRMERALHHAKDYAENLIRTANAIVVVLDANGSIQVINEAAERITGYSLAELKDRSWFETLCPKDRFPDVLEIFSRLQSGTMPKNVENSILTKSGEERYILWQNSEIKEQGRIVGTISFGIDITERKRDSNVLREKQAKLDSLFQAAPVGIGIVEEHIILEVNDRICEMTGYSREELVGESAQMLYATDQEFDFIRHEKNRQIALQGSGSIETRWRRKDGAMIDVLFSSAPLVAGDPSRGVTFTALDITERRRGEDALRSSEKRYRQLIEMLHEGIWTIDSGAITTFVNPRMAEMLGYTVEEMLGKHLFSFMDDRAVEDCRRFLERRFKGIEEEHDFEFVRKDGSRIFVRMRTAPVTDEDGVIVGAIAGVQDQTERRRIEDDRRLFEARIRESQKLESLGILAGGVAHDFNNILQAIQGNLEFAVASLPPEAQARESLAEVEVAAKRAADLVRQLLAYSGKGRFAIGSLNLSRAIRETAQMLAVSISKKAELRLDCASDLPLIEADATQIRQVIMNLIVNASEALGDENGVITVSTGTMECDRADLNGMINGERLSEGRYAFLEVADTGCGMDEETQRKICDPFFTTKSAGRGLGLPVILGVMRGHGGAIRISSERGKGTAFRLIFPASTSTVEQIEASSPPVAGWRGSGTILCVDDEEMVRAVAKRMLEQLGFNVLLASNGAEALAIFRDNLETISCVVLDLTMPRMDGIETLAVLRRISGEVKVILSSGYSEHEISKRVAGKGFSGFIEKPYRLSELGDKLRNVLEARTHGDVEA
jgi:two-component system cell cycle sensor histidine kinase/response regulator CckA